MIELKFLYGTDVEIVTINGNNITFGSPGISPFMSTIEGIKLNKAGVIKEHPDLKDRADWREEAIKRFKELIRGLTDEQAIAEYIIIELKKFGHIPKMKKINGFRGEPIK